MHVTQGLYTLLSPPDAPDVPSWRLLSWCPGLIGGGGGSRWVSVCLRCFRFRTFRAAVWYWHGAQCSHRSGLFLIWVQMGTETKRESLHGCGRAPHNKQAAVSVFLSINRPFAFLRARPSIILTFSHEHRTAPLRVEALCNSSCCVPCVTTSRLLPHALPSETRRVAPQPLSYAQK